MTVLTDSRGYKYIGSQIEGQGIAATWGNQPHDSVNGGGPTTSFVGQACEAVYGVGHWGLNATNSGPWSSIAASPAGTEFIWQFVDQQPDLVGIDVTSYSPNANTWTNTPINQFGCGLKLRPNSSSNPIMGINSIYARVNTVASQNNPFINQRDLFWISVTPNSFGVFCDDFGGGNAGFFYAGAMQGTLFSYPTNICTVFAENVGAQSSQVRRPRLQGLANTRGIVLEDSVYSDGLALLPNSTGEPYLTRYYPIEAAGTAIGSTGGYLPELYIYHNNDIAVGTTVNTADLNGSGTFVFDTLDGSDFTYCMCVASLDSGNKRLFMRIGEAS